MAKEKVNPRHFYREKLPMIVWDPRNNSPLCDFSEGHLITDDEYTIGRLLEIGYPEIPLDATHPPEIIEPIQPAVTPDVKPVPAGLTEKAALALQTEKKTKVPESPAAGVSKPKNTPSSKPKKTAAKKVIKRRKK